MRNFSRGEKINIIDPGGGTGDTAAGKDEWCASYSVEVMAKSFLLVNEASSLTLCSLLTAHPNLFKVEMDTCCTSEGESFTK